jgi:hypothetical protein
MKFLCIFLALPLIAICQTPATGVSADWDISPTVDALSQQAARLKPILDQLNPRDWVAKGASETYIQQSKGANDELGYLTSSAKLLALNPERLTLALDTYFRLQSLEMRLNSLVDGVRNYQNPAIGDLLMGVLAENSSNRDKLRQYITDLATTKEQEFKIVDQEAQRCRGVLTHQTPAPKPVVTKKQ